MGQFKEYVKIAMMNIRHNRGRSFLTMLGIIIGISSVIMVLTIGNGVKSNVNSELENIAGGQVALYVDTTKKDTTVTFSEEDLVALESIEHVKGVGTKFNLWGTGEGPKGSADCRMYGGNTALQYDSKEPIIKGRYFSESEFEAGALVCVIDEASAKILFGSTDVVGMSFDATMWGITRELKIVGVRKSASNALISMFDGGGYIQADVPYTACANAFGLYTDEIDVIYLYGESSTYCTEIAKKGKTILESRHNCAGENQIMMESFSDVSGQFDSILGIITVFVSFVAAISLFVGGIGVMNIMLVSVTERTREIGIRKSLGARTRSIMLQFLAEAGIITMLGGIIGIILGVGGAYIVCAVMNVQAYVSPVTVLFTTIFSCGVGVFFGIYPAKKAAALRPIEALRHE